MTGPWLTAQEAAHLLGVTPRQVNYWIARGALKARTSSPRRRRVHALDVAALMATRSEKGR